MIQRIEELTRQIIEGDRRSLARAITLIESNKPDQRADAAALISAILPKAGRGMRVGITGAPGTGKSTLIERLGLRAIAMGHRVAVLAIDPSSRRSGGSILGDKTRMTELGNHPDAFIRPTPAGAVLGGVARSTREAALLCHAGGFDVVFIETVGVGQSEVAVADMVDLFMLVASPSGGDELQGIKRGIMELADLIVVNKADGELLEPAQRAAADLRSAVGFLRPKRPGWTVDVVLCSARSGEGIDVLWAELEELHGKLEGAAQLEELRAAQALAAMWEEVSGTLVRRLEDDPRVHTRLESLAAEVAAGTVSPAAAAAELLSIHEVSRSAEDDVAHRE